MGNSKKVLIKSSRNPGGQLQKNLYQYRGYIFFWKKVCFYFVRPGISAALATLENIKISNLIWKNVLVSTGDVVLFLWKLTRRRKSFFKFNYRVLVKKSVSHYKRRVLLLVTITICHHSKNYNWMYISVIQYLLLPVLMQ